MEILERARELGAGLDAGKFERAAGRARLADVRVGGGAEYEGNQQCAENHRGLPGTIRINNPSRSMNWCLTRRGDVQAGERVQAPRKKVVQIEEPLFPCAIGPDEIGQLHEAEPAHRDVRG